MHKIKEVRCLDIKRAETKFILTQAALDAWDMFKKIVWVICAVAVVAAVGMGVNWLFALALFVGVPVVTGLAWAVVYRWCFDSGAMKLEQVDPGEDTDGKGDE
nr:MAG TPA: hypothetical protein [Caudoviricetes sp.]